MHVEWRPVERSVDFGKPSIQFWPEDEGVDLRYLKYKSPEGLVTVLVRDTALGIPRERMSATILDLNSDDKLKTFEAIGQFGHGGHCGLIVINTASGWMMYLRLSTNKLLRNQKI
jgi:hypothetical protein